MTKWIERLSLITLLAGIVAIPLAFNLYSQRVFEPEKAFLLRSMALLLAIFGGVRLSIAKPFPRPGRVSSLWDRPRLFVLIPAMSLSVVMIFATFRSVASQISWAGSYEWRQGAFTFLACLIIFLFVSWYPFEAGKYGAIITAIEFAGLAVALYGLLQYFGLDPIPWRRTIEGRAFATLGHPNFLAAYLVLAIPLAGASLFTSKSRQRQLLHGMALSVSLFCLLLTYSRSGWLGLLAAGFCFAVFQIKWSSSRYRWLAAVLIATVVLVGLSILAYLDPGGIFSYSSLEPLHSFLRGKSATAEIRTLTWQGAWQVWQKSPWIGFGPETFHLTLARAYPPGLTVYGGQAATGDHAHNEILDWALNAGVLGVVAYAWLVVSVFYVGLRSVPHITNKTQRNLLFGLLSGLAGYSVQNQLSFAVIAPLSLFWIMLGLVVAIAHQALNPLRPSEISAASDSNKLLLPRSKRIKPVFLLGTAVFAIVALSVVVIPHAYALRADIYARQARDATIAQNWEEAITHYQKALGLSPTQDRYLKDLSIAYVRLALSEQEKRDERFVMAEDALKKAASLSPLDVNYWLSLATLYYEWGVYGQPDKLDLALDLYRRAAAMNPSDPEIWARWGKVYHAQGQYTLAIEKYQEGLRLDPLHVRTYTYLGETYLAMQRIKDAREVYDKIDQVTETLDKMVSKR